MKGKKKFNKHRSKHTINFYSTKNDCHIWCESFLERNYALMLEFDESVKEYASQPESFNVFGRRYTPDFLVEYKSGYAEYVEIKHTHYMDDEFFERHHLRKKVVHKLTGLELVLMSELDIDSVAVGNYDLLLGYKGLDVNHLVPKIGKLSKKLKLSRLEKLVSNLSGGSRAHAWALVSQQHFYFDTSKPFNTETTLMRRK